MKGSIRRACPQHGRLKPCRKIQSGRKICLRPHYGHSDQRCNRRLLSQSLVARMRSTGPKMRPATPKMPTHRKAITSDCRNVLSEKARPKSNPPQPMTNKTMAVTKLVFSADFWAGRRKLQGAALLLTALHIDPRQPPHTDGYTSRAVSAFHPYLSVRSRPLRPFTP